MRTATLIAIVGVAACARQPMDPVPRQPLAAQEHLALAADREARAAEQDRGAGRILETPPRGQAEAYVCGDRVLADQVTSGGEALLSTVPCWSNEPGVVASHRSEAERLRAEAKVHREMAKSLLNAEQLACEGMSADELTHTPFAHRDDVVAVEAEREGETLRGARIAFRPVEGLSANWMRQAVACHRARAAALGYNGRFMSYDPTVLPGASTMVNELADGALEVKVVSPDEATAIIIHDRARALLGDSQARR